jgi:hypothetical protein
MGYGLCSKCCTITVSVTGTVKGCNSTGLVGVPIVLTDHATSSPLGTVTTSTGGALSGATFAGTNGQVVDVSISIPRFQTYTVSLTVSGGTLAIGTVTLTVDTTNYVCLTICSMPISKSQSFVSSGACAGTTWPNATLTFGIPPGSGLSTSVTWSAVVNVTYLGVTWQYLYWQGDQFGLYDSVLGFSGLLGHPTSTTCPTPGGGSFTGVYTCNAGVGRNIGGTLTG